jgi:hypothetical protein
MKIVPDKIDDAVLGLLWLTLHDERHAWKDGHSCEAPMAEAALRRDRHRNGRIADA